MISSPASARLTKSVSWPFASVTEIRIVSLVLDRQIVQFLFHKMDQQIVHVKVSLRAWAGSRGQHRRQSSGNPAVAVGWDRERCSVPRRPGDLTAIARHLQMPCRRIPAKEDLERGRPA